ncbi:Hsp20/alpha crystallin family protein [Halorhodospira neutriphila]|uniref:Heat-shock protein Hsp20 n=1 Tax=Halorhodospira neutriphila TaxID=168379 RepID=A0ABS1E616_9GAMM|nr:Hsp20/alpha crystallin family protein [Halorhodospira neutriphila]MBK1727125.1 heat-shock protein Hsp20 [Halorhodospira neutriphila]
MDHLMRYDPWNALRQLQTDLDRFFAPGTSRPSGALGRSAEEEGETASNWLPAVDISEDERAYNVHVDLPGVAPEQIDVAMDNGMLTIKGQRESDESESGPDWKRVERVRGTFFRRFTLPENVDPEGIQARSRNGVLEVRVPKRQEEPAKRIKVEAAEE